MTELLTVPEAADRLGLTAKAVQPRIERGKLESVRKDGRRLIPAVEVDRVMEVEVSQVETRLSALAQAPQPGEFSRMLERLETLAAENGRFRALAEVGESARQELEEELHRVRAQVRELEAKLTDAEVVERAGELVAAAAPRARWWRRSA